MWLKRLWLAEFGVDLGDFCGSEGAAGEGCQRAQAGKETQYAIKSAKLLAQATGDFTRQELNGDASFRWTKAAKEKIDAIVTPAPTPGNGD